MTPIAIPKPKGIPVFAPAPYVGCTLSTLNLRPFTVGVAYANAYVP